MFVERAALLGRALAGLYSVILCFLGGTFYGKDKQEKLCVFSQVHVKRNSYENIKIPYSLMSKKKERKEKGRMAV